MSLAGKLIQKSDPPSVNRLTVQLTPSSNYATGGDTFDLTAITDPNGVGIPGFNQAPVYVDIVEMKASGYYGEFQPGTTLKNGKVKFFTAGGAEVSAGAYPSQLTGATIFAVIELVKGDQ